MPRNSNLEAAFIAMVKDAHKAGDIDEVGFGMQGCGQVHFKPKATAVTQAFAIAGSVTAGHSVTSMSFVVAMFRQALTNAVRLHDPAD